MGDVASPFDAADRVTDPVPNADPVPHADPEPDRVRVRVPVLHSPFASRLNPYAERAERRALSWAARIGLVDPDTELAQLARQGFGRLAGRSHPDLTLAALADVCRWYLWFAILDDHYCDRPPPGTGIGWLAARLAGIARALTAPVLAAGETGTVAEANLAATDIGTEAPDREPEPDPAERAAADLARRTAARATDEQYRRLLAGFDATFFGLLWESAARRPDTPVDLVSYSPMRRAAGALPAFLTLAEIHGDRPPPPAELARPEVAVLASRLGNLIMWQNDIRSYQAEAAAGGAMLSLVTVLAQERDLDTQAAVDLAAQLWTAELDRYREARDRVLALGSPALRRYADRLHELLAGFLTWPYETVRYD
jgi:hypothetical protein